jgi:hypothetical protein
MADLFDVRSDGKWNFSAQASTVLGTTMLALSTTPNGEIKFAAGPAVRPAHDAAYWDAVTAGFDFSCRPRAACPLQPRIVDWADGG